MVPEEESLILQTGNQELRFSREQLQQAAEMYARCIQKLGIKEGELVQIYDFGSSPVVFLFEHNYCSLPIKGAAEILNLRGLLNDGITDFLGRGLYAIRVCNPTTLIIRKELLGPLVQTNKQLGEIRRGKPSRIIATADRDLISREELNMAREQLGVEIAYVLRVDPILFFAYSCNIGGLLHFHFPRRNFEIEAADKGWKFKSLTSGAITHVSGDLHFGITCPNNNAEWASFSTG